MTTAIANASARSAAPAALLAPSSLPGADASAEFSEAGVEWARDDREGVAW
jgi:hypothetical protein